MKVRVSRVYGNLDIGTEMVYGDKGVIFVPGRSHMEMSASFMVVPETEQELKQLQMNFVGLDEYLEAAFNAWLNGVAPKDIVFSNRGNWKGAA